MKNKTVVITGASSGIGRATALNFAKQGANLALIARDREGLESLACEVRDLGGQALFFACDVTDPSSMENAAKSTAHEFGGIDVWVNNAAVAIYGEANQIPLVEQRRLMDVNFFGQVIGTQTALPFLENAPSGGTLINILSVLAEAATPLQSVYTASKHALYGYFKCLREELIHRNSKVKICNILPSSMATPYFDHAKTYIGFKPRPFAPTYAPERVAETIVEQASSPNPKFAKIVGGFGHTAVFLFRHLPTFAHWIQGKTGYRAQTSKEPKTAGGPNNIFTPLSNLAEVRGTSKVSKTVNAIETHPALTVLGIVCGYGLWKLVKNQRGSLLSTIISTRRFFARPASVSLEETGWNSANPDASR